jgi:outer membrane murein-binding lipoprotein Lpp
VRILAVLIACLALAGCITDRPEQAAYVAPADPVTPENRCQKLAAAVANPYASPGTVQMGMEAMRNYHCLGN